MESIVIYLDEISKGVRGILLNYKQDIFKKSKVNRQAIGKSGKIYKNITEILEMSVLLAQMDSWEMNQGTKYIRYTQINYKIIHTDKKLPQ